MKINNKKKQASKFLENKIKNKKIRLKVVMNNPIAIKLNIGFKKLNFFIGKNL